MKNKYNIKELTPLELRCGTGTCPSIYELEELTPREMQCGIGSCPSIYKLRELTSVCPPFGYCPTVYDEEGKDVYIIIGKQLDPKKLGLEEKIGEGETVIEIPKGLLKNLVK
ncbi:hypothetical protein HYX17_03065 [Candidatus Woesearchaeota archaeon]|nr:hypothetical protein [Candidatus Woesearchaeota archaeon]